LPGLPWLEAMGAGRGRVTAAGRRARKQVRRRVGARASVESGVLQAVGLRLGRRMCHPQRRPRRGGRVLGMREARVVKVLAVPRG
jgi:hypothetical protein